MKINEALRGSRELLEKCAKDGEALEQAKNLYESARKSAQNFNSCAIGLANILPGYNVEKHFYSNAELRMSEAFMWMREGILVNHDIKIDE